MYRATGLIIVRHITTGTTADSSFDNFSAAFAGNVWCRVMPTTAKQALLRKNRLEGCDEAAQQCGDGNLSVVVRIHWGRGLGTQNPGADLWGCNMMSGLC